LCSHVLWFPSALDEIRGAIVSQHPTIADPVTRLSVYDWAVAPPDENGGYEAENKHLSIY